MHIVPADQISLKIKDASNEKTDSRISFQITWYVNCYTALLTRLLNMLYK